MKIIEELLSCFLMIILFEFIILKKISKLHLLHFASVFLLFYVYSHGIDFENHGYYNIVYYFIILITFIVLLLLFGFLISIEKKKILLLLILSSLIILLTFQYLFNYFTDCKEWSIGLNNTNIDNNKTKYGCQIKIPKSCPYKIGKFFLDRNRFSSLDCRNKNLNSRENILINSNSPFINKNTLHIGYPLINKNEDLFLDENYLQLKNYFLNNLYDMDNTSLIKSLNEKQPEITIDFTKNKNGQMNINLNFNKTLSEERKKIEGFSTPYSKNIIILYIDSVSRAYSVRQLKKTLKFVEKFITFKGYHDAKFPSDNFHSFQFFKYYSFYDYTVGNYPIIFYGNHRDKKKKFITKHLKKNGFVTGYSSDHCYIDFAKSLHNFTFDDIYDHQFVICDPNKQPASPKLNCFYEKIHLEYLFEYANQFWEKYDTNRKFISILTNFAHEGSIEMLKYIDDIIYKYFNNLFNKNLLKETSIFLLGDHGVSLPSIYYLNDFFLFEKVLPMLYLIINDRKNVNYEKQYKYLHQNQQTFITGFDIYNTMLNIIYGDKYYNREPNNNIFDQGKSLFSEINQTFRNPKKYRRMPKYACT